MQLSPIWTVALLASMMCHCSCSLLKKGMARRSDMSSIQAGEGSLKLRSQQAPLLVPQPNDTIPAAYWSQVEFQLQAAGASTPKPLTYAERQRALIKPDPWNEVTEERQPYDTLLGASILGSLNDKPTQTPAPSQEVVSQAFVAQCPMLVFGSHLFVRAPHCGEPLGSWNDPQTDRNILRWDQDHDINVRWGVDSVMHGNGSTTYMTLNQEYDLTGSSTRFELRNCLGVVRYTIEEKITAVQQMGYGESTWRQHDSAMTKKAFFYQYKLWSPNGTMVAQTNLFRMNSGQVNITMTPQHNAPGTLVAMAQRDGNWNRDGWRKCKQTSNGTPRQWMVNFMISQRELQTVATVMDLRVASAAMIQLMALRDEQRNQETGLDEQGENWTMWSTVSKYLWISVACLLALCFMGACVYTGGAEYLRKKASRVQDRWLPKKSTRHRLPAFQPTY